MPVGKGKKRQDKSRKFPSIDDLSAFFFLVRLICNCNSSFSLFFLFSVFNHSSVCSKSFSSILSIILFGSHLFLACVPSFSICCFLFPSGKFWSFLWNSMMMENRRRKQPRKERKKKKHFHRKCVGLFPSLPFSSNLCVYPLHTSLSVCLWYR